MNLTKEYKTGVIWQDFQHRQLIDLFQKVMEAKNNDTDQNLYRYTVAFLAMYVNHHFSLEEQYMEQYDFPGREEHIREHKAFIKELKAFRSENNTYTSEGADKLIKKIGEWIMGHILDIDKQLGEFIIGYEKDQCSAPKD